jgi:hypothetical protein
MLSWKELHQILQEAPFPFLEELVVGTSEWPIYGFRCVYGDNAPECDYTIVRIGHRWLNEYLVQSEKWRYLLKWPVIRKLDPPGDRCSCQTCYRVWKADNE